MATQAVAQAIAKVQEIEASTSIASGEKSNRKKAVFDAAEAIRASVEKDVTAAVADAAVTALTANDQARALAQVAMSVKVAGDQMKTEDITKLFDNSGKGKSSIDGMAQKISSDIAAQIATKTAANLGDINLINPTTVLGATALNTITTAEHGHRAGDLHAAGRCG
ncbi:MAG: hypothetical protein HYU75_04460 [Betaproteobacteria bacterium]|nr:hypothetical protein [Betaproteobacteria bacterium]